VSNSNADQGWYIYDDLAFSTFFPDCNNIDPEFWELESFKNDKWWVSDWMYDYKNGTEAE